MNSGEKPPYPQLVTESGTEKVDFKKVLTEFLPESLQDIAEMRYAEAFERFADKLHYIERLSNQTIHEKAAQKIARSSLTALWKAFIKDITDHKKKSARLEAMNAVSDEAVKKVLEESAAAHKYLDDLPEETRKYYAALIAQRSTQIVVPFPNKESSDAQLARNSDQWIQEIANPIDKAYEPSMQHIAYIGALFNSVLPLVRKYMEGYTKPMMAGETYMSNFLPVTSDTINANIVNFLKEAHPMAKTLGELSIDRDKTNSNVRRSSTT